MVYGIRDMAGSVAPTARAGGVLFGHAENGIELTTL
jgi:hypothetical protein